MKKNEAAIGSDTLQAMTILQGDVRATKSADSVIRIAYPLFQEEGGGSIPTSALQLRIGEIGVVKACLLNSIWHSRFPKIEFSNVTRNKHYVCYAAEFDGVIYAVAIWSSPIALNRMNRKSCLELRRFAIAPDAPKNTASRMIRIMIAKIKSKFKDINHLISYQDKDVHSGTIYKASGWIPAGESVFKEWDYFKRKRSISQSNSSKVRWEREI